MKSSLVRRCTNSPDYFHVKTLIDLVLTNTLRLNSWYKSKFICPLGFSYMEIILSILLDGWALPQQVLQFCHFWAGSYHSAVKQLSHMSFCVWFHGSQMGCLLIWTLNRMEWSINVSAQLLFNVLFNPKFNLGYCVRCDRSASLFLVALTILSTHPS